MWYTHGRSCIVESARLIFQAIFFVSKLCKMQSVNLLTSWMHLTLPLWMFESYCLALVGKSVSIVHYVQFLATSDKATENRQ